MLFRQSQFMKWIMLGALMIAPVQSVTANDASPLRFRLTGDPTTLDWNLARSSHETYIIMNVMEGLVEEGKGSTPQPALAEKWEVSPDGKVYTFYLKSGVKWSDGKSLTADDFVTSWRRVLSPRTDSSYASFLFDVENAEAFHQGKIKDPSAIGIKALSDSRLQVKLRRIVPYFLHIPSFWVTFPMRKDLAKSADQNQSAWIPPATLGPYRITEWKRGKSIRLERNPNYSGTKPPAVASIEAVIESDDAKARELFRTGALDFLLDATTADLMKSAGGGSGARVQQFPYLATYYLGFNVQFGPLKNVNVRKALALVLDRTAIPGALQGGQVPAKGWIPPGMQGFDSGAQLEGTLYDARGALSRAGFPEGAGFPRLPIWIEKFDGAQALGKFITQAFREKLGIEVQVQIGTAREYQQALKKREAALFVGHWGADYPDPANFFEVFASGSGTNSTGWTNASYDQHLSQARSTLDSKLRLASYLSAEKVLIQDEVAIVPLFYKRNTVLLGARIREFVISPLNYLFLKDVQLAQ